MFLLSIRKNSRQSRIDKALVALPVPRGSFVAATGQGTLPNRSLQESSPYAARYAVKRMGTIGRSRILRVLPLQFLVDLS